MNEKEKAKIGTCMQMCPPDEIKLRPPNPFEYDLNGKFKPELAIKEYQRSNAGKLIRASDIRPLPVLVKTLDHIIHYVIGQKTNTSPKTSEIQMYYFVGDRLRSIRTDIIVQDLKGAETIQILQASCLFFIWAGSHFNMEDINVFDHKQNLEQITQSILSLNQLYDLYFIDNQKHYPSEAFFRAIDLISYLVYPGYMAKLLSFPIDIINSKYVQAVMEVRKAILTRDISLFFSILNCVPIQMASYILQNSRILWDNTAFALRRSFAQMSFPITFLTNFLKVPENILDTWFNSFSIIKKPDQKNINYNTRGQIDMKLLPSVIVPEMFLRNRNFNDPLSFFNLDETIDSSVNVPLFPKNEVHDSTVKVLDQKAISPLKPEQGEEEDKNDVDIKKEIAQPVETKASNNEIGKENLMEQETNQLLAVPTQKVKIIQEEPQEVQENIPMTPPEPEMKNSEINVSMILNESNSDSHIPKFLPNRPNSTNPKLSKKLGSRVSINNKSISKKNLINDNPDLFEAKISIKDIMAMIPYKVPRMSYVCILLIADDQSVSSFFALDRFITKNGDANNNSIVLCEKLVSSTETCYVLITKDQNQLGVTSILDCNDTKDFENEFKSRGKVSLIKFDSKFGFSSILNFNSCLRKAIENGITEIKPFNLSDLVQNAFSSFLTSISYTSWQFASANAVFKFLNMGLSSISKLLVDGSFTKFILPFEHQELDFNELKKYSDKINSMQFKLIDNTLSRRSVNGSNWPSYIKERINIVFPPFIIPLSIKFDPKSFISNLMSKLPFQEPSETIFYI